MTRWMRSSSGRLALVGLLVLLVVDAALVALAFRPDAVGAAPVSTSSRPTSPAPTPTADPSGTAESSAPVPLRQVVVALDDTRAWRAVLGTCDKGGAAIEVTSDGGRTWGSRALPAGTTAFGRVQPVSADRAFVIGADASCVAGEYVTDDAARTWEGPRDLEGAWSRTPGGAPGTAVTPGRKAARPCGPGTLLDLSRVTARSARALCADGSVTTSSDGGDTWSDLARVGGALALSVREEKGSGRAYVARVAEGCDGVEIARVTATATTRVACVEVTDGLPDGRVSLSVVKEAGWLAVGDATWRAGADLRTWSPTA